MISSFERAPQFYVRLSGLFYLVIIGLGLFGELMVRGTLVVPSDAAATAINIAASTRLWSLGIVGDLSMQLLDIPIIVLFYLLFKRVNAGLNLAATFFNLIQTAMLVANKVLLVIPLLLLGGMAAASVFPSELLAAWSYLAIRLHGYGFAIGLIFFAFACLLRGYLIIQSGFFPAFIGGLLVVAGGCYLVNSLALLLTPDLAALLFPWIMIPVLAGELTLSLWMMIKGVNMQKWRQSGIEN
ncbi:DUF4386 domain-containing protein [Rheinheimera sp. 1928-s]|uniref:DUF4386 domain-containing protein n=1 Tax=Rheinheimera sp. 1928-s TaxID=3033803 RepID=UPI00260AB125|nr:DUF4386 domain-containing protein [Rheinheimera sp. 1928-s]MDF3127455.1 DUF4386 domain-containing protein [Rheinheimera sp. 1928-s]